MAKGRETLSGLFAPPRDDLHGIGGVLCAYSADAEFLEQALSRFSRVPAASRLARGSVDWTLMLDPAHPMLPPGEVGGLQHLRPRAAEVRPWAFSCMHAKVALLAFGSARTGGPTWFRLLVTTGNWTRESACHQLEMAWFLDVDTTSAAEADRHELAAVAGFLGNLLRCYQGGGTLTARAELILASARLHGRRPDGDAGLRFLATLPTEGDACPGGLLRQMAPRLGKSRFDDLVCGSGFFERTRDPAEQPRVLQELDRQLAQHLARSPRKRLVANPSGDDQVIASFRSGGLKDWTLHRPADPSGEAPARERLHAKFLFLGTIADTGYSDARLYLGSGNLSVRGFLVGPRRHDTESGPDRGAPGNVEAGVLLRVPEIRKESQISRALPIGRELSKKDLAAIVVVPAEDSPAETPVPPAPILAFVVAAGGHLDVAWDDTVEVPAGVEVLLPGAPAVRLAPGQGRFPQVVNELPRSLEIRWGLHQCRVPCLNHNGEHPRRGVAYPHFEAWLDQLRGYPQTWDDPGEDGDADDEDGEPRTETDGLQSTAGGEKRDFPARTAMMLVEAVAELNGAIPEDRASDWLHALRHLLIDEKPVNQIAGWRSLKVNFLRPLHSPEGFAPEWSDLTAYAGLLDDVARAWQIHEHVALELVP
jgi:hypothetical protein